MPPTSVLRSRQPLVLTLPPGGVTPTLPRNALPCTTPYTAPLLLPGNPPSFVPPCPAPAMQIRLTPDLDAQTQSVRADITVDEFLARFPEVPRHRRREPVLAEYLAAFGPLLRLAEKPTPCVGSGGDMEHVFYTRLVNDMAIYGIGLAKRDRTLARLRATVDQYRKQPATFACTLRPRKAPGTKRAGRG